MTKRTQAFVSLVFLALLMLPGLALADFNGRGPQPPVAELDVLGTAIVFHPVTEFKRLSLTVTGPAEYVFERVVNKGELVFELSEETIDGCYTYELRVTPNFDPSILEILRESRETGDTSQVAQLRRDGKLPSEAHVQAGGFNVIEGRIVLSDDIEKSALDAFDGDIPPKAKPEAFGTGQALLRADAASGIPTKDFVILDDLIVDGSACIGFDCVNGESFGFDTIRLKENNLRIKFDDTSVAASFPRNDWQLTANDSANGGASKFSIDDISGSRTPFTVEANARSHSLYVDDGGRIGSRTSTPSVEIHTIDGDTPTLRLQQDGSSGFAPQTWDVAGNETNFFIRDVTNGSQLPFRIRPDAPTNSIFVDVDGDVGLGTASPSTPLHVLLGGTAFAANPATAVLIQNTNTNGDGVIFSMVGGNGTGGNSQMAFGDTDSEFQGRIVYDHGDLDRFRFYTDAAVSMTLNNAADTNLLEMSNGAVLTSGGVWTNASSREYKENIESLSADAAAAALQALLPVIYNYKGSPGESYVGFIAEEVPDLVATNDRKGLSPMDIVAVLTKVVQQQQQLFEQQEQVIEDQSHALQALRSRLDELDH